MNRIDRLNPIHQSVNFHVRKADTQASGSQA